MKNKHRKILNKVITEAFSSQYGGGSPVQGISSRNAKGYSTGASTPHPGHTMTGPTGYDIDIIRQQEELDSTVPSNLPFPLDGIFEHIVDALQALGRVKSQIKIAVDNNIILPQSELSDLRSMQDKIQKYITELSTMGKDIEKFNINNL